MFANDAQGEGMDRTSLSLPGDQDQLIEAVAAANPRTIVVLNTGGPVLMPWLGRVQAVLEASYPGQQFGAATVELYLASPPAAQEPPKQMRGYQKVALAPGQSTTVAFRLAPDELAYYNAAGAQWAVAPGRYTVLVGTSSTELNQSAAFEVGNP